MVENKARLPGIDIARVFCACLVVMIHCVISDGHPIAHMIVRCFAQQAVPFYFIVSGFFFRGKLDQCGDRKQAVRGFVKKNLGLYFAWVILYLPGTLATYNGLYEDASAIYRLMLILRRIFFAGEGVCWYLLVLAESAVIAGLLMDRKSILYGMAIIGLVLGWIFEWDASWAFFGKINQITYMLFSWSNNVVMKGLPYFAAGIFLAERKTLFRAERKWLAVGYLAVSLVQVISFGLICSKDASLERFMSTYSIQAVLLFLICAQPTQREIPAKWCTVLRDISSTIYFTHTFFIYDLVDQILGNGASTFVRFAVPVGLGVAVYVLAKGLKIKPLCWLFLIKT